jgi:hypothetical protein
MAVRDFELYHGAVLAKILRRQKPVTLSLIESQPREKWSTYTLNDEVDLLVTYSRSPRQISRNGGGTSWTFVFSRNQLRQMDSRGKERRVWVALVCGRKDPSEGEMQVCLLDPEELRGAVDFAAEQQSLTVRRQSGKKLRVFKERHEKFLVNVSRLDTWDLPGG